MLELSIIGYLGSDCIVRTVNNKTVINFSVAHTESYKDKNDVKKEVTTWVECNIWDREVLSQYLKKGTQIMARGLPSFETYEKNGNTNISVKLRVSTIQLLSKKTDELKAETSNKTEKEEANDFLKEMVEQI